MENDIIYETKYWKVILANNQYYLGRCVLDLKRNCATLSELNNEEFQDLLKLIKQLEHSIKKSFNTTMFNLCCLMNNSYKSVIPNPHVHFHLFPRYKNETNFIGEIFKDKEFGDHYNLDNNKEISKEIREKIIKKIQENLQ
jgi:diadenosine tetraphosphate (Ap4A) HIT family hydrolase